MFYGLQPTIAGARLLATHISTIFVLKPLRIYAYINVCKLNSKSTCVNKYDYAFLLGFRCTIGRKETSANQ